MATITSSEPAAVRAARLPSRTPISPDDVPTVRRFSSALVLGDLLQRAGRTDALITAAADLIGGFPWDTPGLSPGERRRRLDHVTELLTMAKRSARSIVLAGERIAGEIARSE
jgi:hypothetical protein